MLTISLLLGWDARLARAAGPPLSEILGSRAGLLIFGELAQGSIAAAKLAGKTIADPASRLRHLESVLADERMTFVAADLEARMNRVHEALAGKDPARAEAIFRRSTGEAAPVELTGAERRVIREAAALQLDSGFLAGLGPRGYRATRDAFVESGVGGVGGAARAISPQERALVFWETRKNSAGAARSPQPLAIEHFEIPLDLVQADVAERIAPELRSSLIFEKNGKPHVRWIVNPEDTRHHLRVEGFLKAAGADAARYRRFEGRQTASRSYILIDPASEKRVVFSAKVSTDVTGGYWQDKRQPFGEAIEARRASDLVHGLTADRPFQYAIPLDEPAVFGIKAIDQAMIVRSLGELPGGEVTYLPGFSAVHADLGARIARANGATDVAAFWNEHYNQPVARAMAELAARTGLVYDSPHSQNFLIEMVGATPTGRIVMRDFGDSHAHAEWYVGSGRAGFLSGWPAASTKEGQFHVGMSLLYGTACPEWLTVEKHERWARDFFAAFEAEFALLTGIPEDLLRATPRSDRGAWQSKSYPIRDEAWRRFFERLGRE